MRLAQQIGRFANLALAAEEHQDVTPLWQRQNLFYRIQHLQRQIPVFLGGTVFNVHGIGAAGYLNNRCIIEVLRETLYIDGRRGDNHFQVGALGENIFQIAEQEVDIQAPFMGLVDNQGIVAVQQSVILNIGEQNTVSHQFNQRVIADLLTETNLITDRFAKWLLQLLSDTVGYRPGRNATRLGVADHAGDAATELKTNFG